MAKKTCPVCGDPNAFPLWVDPEPPDGCPYDKEWHKGRPRSIKNVTECSWQMGKASQAAEFRKLVPDAFDANGKMLPGQLARVLTEYAKHYPGKALVI